MKTLDCRGPCLDPVAATRRALEEMDFPLEVMVDDADVLLSVSQLLGTSGYKYQTVAGHQETKLVVTGKNIGRADKSDAVFLITSNTLGRGSDELGLALMKSFLHTLGQSAAHSTIYFLNSGVKLCAGPEALVDHLQDLLNKHWRLECCGTCLDYFGIKDDVRVGNVTSMYAIVQGMGEANKIISL